MSDRIRSGTAVKRYELRQKWFPCECGCGAKATSGLLRVFEYSDENPLAPDIGGLPGQPWVFSCAFQIIREVYAVEDPEKDVILIEAAREAPPIAALVPMLRLGEQWKCRFLIWERLTFKIRDGIRVAVIRTRRFDIKKLLAPPAADPAPFSRQESGQLAPLPPAA